ncbi:hypothetical protein MMC18_001111 [Xylographa bjoerkii]|nr:hypothetical protein [Xylographa bjoerkii]
MEDPSQAATLNGIPPEIRLRIYSYLLLSEQTVVPLAALAAGKSLEENILRSHYETALFTISRKISGESLSYFYSQNAFVVVETNMTRFLSECCRAIPMSFGHCMTEFRDYVLKLQFYQFIGHASLRHNRCAFAVFSCRYLHNFIRLFNVYHSPSWHVSKQATTTRMDLIFKTEGIYFKGNPGIKLSLVHDLKMLPGFPAVTENHMTLTFRSAPALLNVLTRTGDIVEAKETRTKGDQFHQLGDYDAARGEYLIALSMVTTPIQMNLDRSTLAELDLLYVDLRSKMSVLDSEQKRYKSAIVEATKATQLPGDRSLHELVSEDFQSELEMRWISTLADDHQYENAAEWLEQTLTEVPAHPAFERKLAEVRLLQKAHEAKPNAC